MVKHVHLLLPLYLSFFLFLSFYRSTYLSFYFSPLLLIIRSNNLELGFEVKSFLLVSECVDMFVHACGRSLRVSPSAQEA